MIINDLQIFKENTPLTVKDNEGTFLFIGYIYELRPQANLLKREIISASVTISGLEITVQGATS